MLDPAVCRLLETVLLPRRNAKDLVEIPDDVKEKVEVRLMDEVGEVIEAALEPAAA